MVMIMVLIMLITCIIIINDRQYDKEGSTRCTPLSRCLSVAMHRYSRE